MAVKVIDASAAAALLFNEPEAELVAQRINGHRLMAPDIISYELTSVCLKKLRSEPSQEPWLRAAFQRRVDLEIEQRPVDPDGVLALAKLTRLSAYDASYLWLSRVSGRELITLDQKLERAAAAG
jgi:predicted nucleic acid-binding protein